MIKKIFLATAFVLLSATTSFAQTVTLPAGCVVLVPGTGGNISTNQVGSGGIIGMPDPLGGGVFTFNPLAGQTFSSWTLKGDLSIKTATLVYPPTAGSAPVQSLNGVANASTTIINFNKNYRPSEGIFPSVATWARSKGTISAGFTFVSGACSGVGRIDFEVFKTYTSFPTNNLPKIVGPSCVTPGVPCTFSVDQIASDNANDNIGFDKYYWIGMPPSTGLYYSADNASITFTPLTSVGFTLKCGFGRANPWDSGVGPGFSTNTTAVFRTIGGVPTAPNISATVPSTVGLSNTVFSGCLDTGLSTFSLQYPNPLSGTTYTWSAPGLNWNLVVTSPTAGNSLLTVTGIDNSAGTLKLTINNGSCTPVDFIYTINRKFTPAITIVPSTSACLTGGISSSFSIGPNASVNNTSWSILPVPAFGSFSISTNTPSTTVTVGSSANVSPGTYTLSATSNTSCGGAITLPIYVKPAPPAFTASTPTCVVRGTTPITTFAVTPAGPSGYVWTLPTGWSFGTPPAGTNNNGSNGSNPIIIPNATTNTPVTITVSIAGADSNGCNSDPITRTINYIFVTTNTLQAGVGNCDQYSVNNCGGTISWSVGGVTAVSNGTTVNVFGNTLTLCGNTAPGSVCANVTLNGVVYSTCATSVGTHGLRQSNNNNNNNTSKIEGVAIYPNPNTGVFAIKVDDFRENATAVINDSNGKQVGTYTLKKGDNKITTENLEKGTYFVTLNVDGTTESRQIIIK